MAASADAFAISTADCDAISTGAAGGALDSESCDEPSANSAPNCRLLAD